MRKIKHSFTDVIEPNHISRSSYTVTGLGIFRDAYSDVLLHGRIDVVYKTKGYWADTVRLTWASNDDHPKVSYSSGGMTDDHGVTEIQRIDNFIADLKHANLMAEWWHFEGFDNAFSIMSKEAAVIECWEER